MSLDINMVSESIRQVPGAGLDALRIPGDNAEKAEFVKRMATIRAKATEIANQAWELIDNSKFRDINTGEDFEWPVVKSDYGQPELYSQVYDGETLDTVQEPIDVSFGPYSSRVVDLAIKIDYLGLSDNGIIGSAAWAWRITEEEQTLLLES